jgi:hypothetical protein
MPLICLALLLAFAPALQRVRGTVEPLLPPRANLAAGHASISALARGDISPANRFQSKSAQYSLPVYSTSWISDDAAGDVDMVSP